jgi:TRAP-type mannitol/chloroaromatic compound transport system permease small subunit
MKRFLHTIDQISVWSGKIFSFLILITALLIGFNILMRIFGNPQLWVFDVTLFAAGTVYVVAGAYTLYLGSHVRMDLIFERLSPRTQALLDLITLPGVVVFCGIFLWIGAVRGWESFLIGETFYTAFQPIIWPLKWMIPLGGLLILLQTLAKSIRDFHMVVSGKRLD